MAVPTPINIRAHDRTKLKLLQNAIQNNATFIRDFKRL
jgi:hypothetical protein